MSNKKFGRMVKRIPETSPEKKNKTGFFLSMASSIKYKNSRTKKTVITVFRIKIV